jgi:preprotein translocase subunit SecD
VSRRPGPALRVAGVLAVAAIIVLALAAMTTALLLPGALPGVGSAGESRSSDPSPATGMLHLEYRVMPLDGVQPGPDEVAAVADILRARIDPMGTVEPSVTVADGDRIVVDLAVPADDASVTDPIRALLGTTGRLDFVPLGDTQVETGNTIDLTEYPPIFSGDQVAGAVLGSDPTGGRTIDFTLRPAAIKLFATYTAGNIGKSFAVALDGTVISAPRISEAISDGEVQISQAGVDGWPLADAQRLVLVVQSGQLPFPVQEIANNLP